MDNLIDKQAAIEALERTKRIASHELHGGEVLRTFNVVLNSLINIMSLLPPANNSEKPNSSDTISRQAAIDALRAMQTYKLFAGDDMLLIDQAGAQTELMMLPPSQPEQLEQCPIYGGMCAYPSDQCYDCPRHAGAKMGVTE